MSSSTDIGSLTPDEQAALEQYTAVTNQNIEAAIPLLRRTQWNVQIAISRFFDGEPETDVLQEAIDAAPQDSRTQETLANGFEAESSRGPRMRPAPRIVPHVNQNAPMAVGFPLNVILAPFNLATYILPRVFRLITPFIPFLPGLLARLGLGGQVAARPTRGALRPRDTAARFIREFGEEYGEGSGIPFQEMGYAHSLDEAKQDLKYLLVVLLSPEHDHTHTWVRETLLSSEVNAFLNNKENNIIVWGGSVQDSEAYQVASAFNLTKFPYAALVANTPPSRRSRSSSSSNGMSIIAPLSGVLTPAEFVSKIRRAIDSHAPEMNRLRNERVERDATRSIREQQDSAYERSLAVDRERARKKREEEEQRKKEEEEVRRAEEAREKALNDRQDWRIWRAARILPEPDAQAKEAVRVSVRLPDGERAIRRFDGAAPVEELYAFVECGELLQQEPSKEAAKPQDYEHEYQFRLVSPMPRSVVSLKSGGTIKERIGRNANLIVETVEEDDEED